MSTILDALRKVERARESSREQLLHDPSEPPAPKRRQVSTTMIAVCALLGFAAGVGLALWRSEPTDDELAEPVERAARVATAPRPAAETAPGAPDAPPAVPAPAAAAPPANAPAQRDVPPTVSEVALAPPMVAVAPAHPPDDAPARAPESAPAAPVAGVPTLASVDAPSVAPANRAALPPPTVESALEPSPFTGRGAIARAARGGAAVGTRSGFGGGMGGREPARPGLEAEAPAGAPPAPAPASPEDQIATLAPPGAALDDAGDMREDELAPEESEPATVVPPASIIDTGRSPTGEPRVVLSFLQWSPDPARRFAFISVDGAPSQRVQEGDTPAGLTVTEIRRDGVQFKRESTAFVIRPRH